MRRRTYLRTLAAGGTVVAGVGANASDTVVQTAAAQSDNDWSQQAKLSADDGDGGDVFGDSVSMSGDGTTAIIGASNDEDPNGEGAGSAYVFTESDGEWSQQQKLSANDGDDNDGFGQSVSMSGDGTTAIIGAPFDEDPNDNFAGSAYVFTQSDSEWSQQQKLSTDDGDVGDSFGFPVSLSGDGTTALIGALGDGQNVGSAYVFTQSDSEWSQQQKLSADDGDDFDRFGNSVSMSGDGTTALVGADSDEDPNGEGAGSAYVFTQSDSEWSQQQKLTPDDGDEDDRFAVSVSMSGDGTTALVGANRDEDPNGQDAGSAYVFTESGGEWSQQQKLTPDDGDDNDDFGWSVSMSRDGTTALIGALDDGEDSNVLAAGSAYVFTQNGGKWSQQQKLSANDADDNDDFGDSVSMSGDGTTALVGADSDEDPNGEGAGSAYVFTSGDGGDDGSDGNGGDSSLTAYTNENGVVDSQGLLDAAADFRAGEIDAGTLLDVAAAFRGNPVT